MKSETKTEKLKLILSNMESIAVAFSGGTDSSFLLKIAKDVLGDNVIAITSSSIVFPKKEIDEAILLAKTIGVKQIIIDSEELDIKSFSSNPENRCYICKKNLFKKILEIANNHKIKNVVDGANKDDLNDFRPGRLALEELGIKSPLVEVGFTKQEIRECSKEMGLKTWNKPSFACLASRIPYGEEITDKKLKMIDLAEQYLRDQGFNQVRVRCHNSIARIEVTKNEMIKFSDLQFCEMVYNKFKEIGFTYTALDLLGFRTGSMNEKLT